MSSDKDVEQSRALEEAAKVHAASQKDLLGVLENGLSLSIGSVNADASLLLGRCCRAPPGPEEAEKRVPVRGTQFLNDERGIAHELVPSEYARLEGYYWSHSRSLGKGSVMSVEKFEGRYTTLCPSFCATLPAGRPWLEVDGERKPVDWLRPVVGELCARVRKAPKPPPEEYPDAVQAATTVTVVFPAACLVVKTPPTRDAFSRKAARRHPLFVGAVVMGARLDLSVVPPARTPSGELDSVDAQLLESRYGVSVFSVAGERGRLCIKRRGGPPLDSTRIFGASLDEICAHLLISWDDSLKAHSVTWDMLHVALHPTEQLELHLGPKPGDGVFEPTPPSGVCVYCGGTPVVGVEVFAEEEQVPPYPICAVCAAFVPGAPAWQQKQDVADIVLRPADQIVGTTDESLDQALSSQDASQFREMSWQNSWPTTSVPPGASIVAVGASLNVAISFQEFEMNPALFRKDIARDVCSAASCSPEEVRVISVFPGKTLSVVCVFLHPAVASGASVAEPTDRFRALDYFRHLVEHLSNARNVGQPQKELSHEGKYRLRTAVPGKPMEAQWLVVCVPGQSHLPDSSDMRASPEPLFTNAEAEELFDEGSEGEEMAGQVDQERVSIIQSDIANLDEEAPATEASPEGGMTMDASPQGGMTMDASPEGGMTMDAGGIEDVNQEAVPDPNAEAVPDPNVEGDNDIDPVVHSQDEEPIFQTELEDKGQQLWSGDVLKWLKPSPPEITRQLKELASAGDRVRAERLIKRWVTGSSMLGSVITGGDDPETCGSHSALHAALARCSGETVLMLLSWLPDNPEVPAPGLNARCAESGLLPLHSSMNLYGESLNLVNSLVKKRASVNATSLVGGVEETVLVGACRSGASDLIMRLIELDADANAQSADGRGPLHLCCERGLERPVQKMLERHTRKEKGCVADLDAKDKNGRSALTASLKAGHKHLAEALIKEKANVNILDSAGMTPLFYAITAADDNLCKLMIKNGAKKDAVSPQDGRCVLHVAIQNRNQAVAQALVVAMCNVQTVHPKDGRTALHLACSLRMKSMVDILIQHGAGVNTQSAVGDTPLRLAVQARDLATVETLCDNGADVNKMNQAGCAPIHAALAAGEVDLARFLVSRGADLQLADVRRWQPIHYGSASGKSEVVEWLLDQGADVNARSYLGRTPIQVSHGASEETLKAVERFSPKGQAKTPRTARGGRGGNGLPPIEEVGARKSGASTNASNWNASGWSRWP
jgi:ankyrin repeat protein